MELLTQLEDKINVTLENYELLNLEIEELKEQISALTAENTKLTDQQLQWENKVKSLLNVFSAEDNAIIDIVQNTEDESVTNDMTSSDDEYSDEEMAS